MHVDNYPTIFETSVRKFHSLITSHVKHFEQALFMASILAVSTNSKYEVCLKSNGTVTLHKKLLSQRKSIAFYDVTMFYGFKNQISAFCDNYILFSTFFCKGIFFVTIL